MIPRRTFVLAVMGTVLAALSCAGAQSRSRIPRIGWLGGPTREAAQPFLQPFLDGLKDLGWVERQNIVIEWRFAGGNAERLPALARDLVGLRVELIVVPSTPTVLAARNVTATTPLVAVSINDPVALGLVPSLARPGGNITGLTASLGPEIAGKQLELLKQAAPNVTRVSVLWNPGTFGSAQSLEETRAAGRRLGVQLQILEARSAGDFNGAFAAMDAMRAGALLILSDVVFYNHRDQLSQLAAKSRIPAMYPSREFVDDGGLMSYGAKFSSNFRRAATYVDKILKGARPADLPIERPTLFELVINSRAAKAIALTIPPSVLARADEVIS